MYIIIAAVIALGLSLYMYGYKSRLRPGLRWSLGILRFLTLATLGLLLINPKIKKQTYFTEKPSLNILMDNSRSVAVLERDSLASELLSTLQNNSDLADRFKINSYKIDQQFSTLDSLNFSGNATNISEGLESLEVVYDSQSAATVLISDGNQTLGSDYLNLGPRLSNPVFPVVLGDTTRFEDLRIERLNANRYAYQDNEFPVELSLSYTGDRALSTNLIIRNGNQVVSRETLQFDRQNNAQTLQVLLKAEQVGIQSYTVSLSPTEAEMNTRNNTQQFAVEVIDQSTKVAIISAIQHPDLGALKKAITTPMIELFLQNVADLDIPKRKTLIIVITCFIVLGFPSAWSLDFFSNQDWVWGVGLIVTGLFILIGVAMNKPGLFKEQHIDAGSDLIMPTGYFKLAVFANIAIACFLIYWWLSQDYSSQWFNEDGIWDIFGTYSNASTITQWGSVIIIGIILNKYLYKKFVKS